MQIRFDIQKDLRLLPFSPMSQKDTLEVRLQLPPQEQQTGRLQVCIDTQMWFDKTVTTREKSYTMISFRHSLMELSGTQNLHILWNGKTIGITEFTVQPPENTVDGGFVILGNAESACVTEIFGDKISQLTDEDWKTLMDEYKALGFSCILIQMAVGIKDFSDNTLGAYFDSALFPRAYTKAGDPIGSILEQCEKNGQTVFLGMCSPLFKGDMETTGKLMKELYSRYSGYRSFYGWYASWEFGLLRPDKRKSGLLTDGLLSGAQPIGLDSYLSVGYLLEHRGDCCRCSVTVDLEAVQEIDRVRCFTSHNPEFNPDHVLAEFSEDAAVWSYLGENNGCFVNGWADLIPDRPVCGRYVRLTYQKANPGNWRTWLILEDVEILRRWKEQ